LSSSDAIALVEVRSKAELLRFIRLQTRLNAGDPNFVPPLEMERVAALTPATNPFFEHAQVQLWLAVRGGRDVGRISAQIDALAPVDPTRTVGHFGMIAAEDDAAVFTALFGVAEAWLKARGCEAAMGPFNLSVNEEIGLLVDGFDTPPMVMMGHDPAYVPAQVEAQGYAKAKDVYAYLCMIGDTLPEATVRRANRPPGPGVVIRMLDMSRYDAEVATMTRLLNDAWKDNWGFTPTTEAETRQLGKALKDVIDRRLIWFGEIDGETVGFVVLLPNVNEAIADLKGRLLPFGWAKLLWRLKVRGLKSIRVPLMGISRAVSRTHRGRLLPFQLMEAGAREAKALGYERYEFSWILEDNAPMRRISEVMNGRRYKTYRIYQKTLA
jgi:GNAT superfamily N-acetyltransferase